jgi:hypothetical protein
VGKGWTCVLVTVILASCEQAPSGSRPVVSLKPSPSTPPSSLGTPAGSATGRQQAADVLIVVTAYAAEGQSGSLTLYRLDGTEAVHFTVKPGLSVLGAAGFRIFVASGDQLKAIRRDGSVESLGSLGTSELRWFAPNSDGTRWIWGTYDGASSPTRSAVHFAGDGIKTHVVEEMVEPGRALAPLSWTQRGAYVQAAPVYGHGGYFPFARVAGWLLVEGSVHKLDPLTGQVTPLPVTNGCAFGDQASDHSVVCFPGGASLRIYAQSGKITNVALARPRFNIPGEAFCAPAEPICTVAGATGVGNGMQYPDSNPRPEQYGTDLIRTDGSISRFGPDGVAPAMGPQSWLPDGRLVVWRRPGAAGGAPGIYVLDRSAHGPFIPTTNEPLGYLS